MLKNIVIFIVVLGLLGVGAYFLLTNSGEQANLNDLINSGEDINSDQIDSDLNNDDLSDGDNEDLDQTETIIGQSVENKDLMAYHFGQGSTELLFVGGIHGGYSWNTVLLAYQLIDYLKANENEIPQNIKVTVIPVLNPDGLNKVVGKTGRFLASEVPTNSSKTIPGRFNANNVDLSRNFDCNWQAESKWQSRTVDAGSAVFSEPEARVLRDYVNSNKPEAVVVWYSAAGGVFSSSCNSAISENTKNLTSLYAKASGYKAYDEFEFYDISGDPVNWLAKQNISAISVLLTNHTDIEWTKNLNGIKAMFKNYSN